MGSSRTSGSKGASRSAKPRVGKASRKSATEKKAATKKAATKKAATKKAAPVANVAALAALPIPSLATALTAQPFLQMQLAGVTAPPGFVNPRALSEGELAQRIQTLGVRPTVSTARLLSAVNRINIHAGGSFERLPSDLKASVVALRSGSQRFHGAKISLAWFPGPLLASPCADKFGYLCPKSVRDATKLPFNAVTLGLLKQLGDLMGDTGRDAGPDSNIPAGYTYVGQFVDHDITLDVSSSLDAETDANTIHNMRSPALDLDSMYGRGPALDPFLYAFPATGELTAIKMQLGSNLQSDANGPVGVPNAGGPGGAAGSNGMKAQRNWDVPRVHNPLDPAASTLTAILGDPRNDENLIVSQFHHAMLRLHNRVIDLLALAGFAGDHFVEARKIVTQHYQWAVVHDFLRRVCGDAAVDDALLHVKPAVNSAYRMPVEFAVAAYRFGHSMVRGAYWVNFNFINASLGQVFEFIRQPNIPVRSNWVVDFNAFFDTGVSVPVNNKARPIDSVLAKGLESLPGVVDLTSIMAVLASRNLRRGAALGLPSGQGVAGHFGMTPMTSAQLQQGLPANEITLLNSNGGILLQKTPLWYYVLREAAVLGGGNRLGPVGAKIVADNFIRILRRDAGSFLNVAGGFTPMLPSKVADKFTFADLVIFAGVTQP